MVTASNAPSGVRQNTGFTLVEAVLAIAIMSISAFALLAAASRCLAVARTSRNYHAAVAILDQGELEHPLVPTNEVFENEVDDIDYLNGFTFSRAIEEVEDEEDEDMFIVRTKVRWAVRGREAFEEVTTYLYTTNHPE